jgi:hypothetical protein
MAVLTSKPNPEARGAWDLASERAALPIEALKLGALMLEREGLEVVIAGWRTDPDVHALRGLADGSADRLRRIFEQLVWDVCRSAEPHRATAMVTAAQALALTVLEDAPLLTDAPEGPQDVAGRLAEWGGDADVRDLRCRTGGEPRMVRAGLERLTQEFRVARSPAGAVGMVTAAKLLAVAVLDEGPVR